MRSVLRTDDLSLPDAASIFDLADWLLPRILPPDGPRRLKLDGLRGVSGALLFYEPSTRTRVSFELAAKLLGGDVVGISASGSSIEKGESLRDTAMTLEAMGFNLAVLRHRCADAAELFAGRFSGAVINGGTGRGEHPTQALLDAFTLRRHGLLEAGRGVLIVGDIANSRVMRSTAELLTRLGLRVTLCAPPSLLPPAWLGEGAPYAWTPDLDVALGKADALVLLRMQRERMDGAAHTGAAEYAKLYGLNARRLGLLRPGALIMHPGPVNRGVEVGEAVFADPRCAINAQVGNGVAIRAALLCWALGKDPRD
jgi:aspartate carbamoyltransferase catalytic subunit